MTAKLIRPYQTDSTQRFKELGWFGAYDMRVKRGKRLLEIEMFAMNPLEIFFSTRELEKLIPDNRVAVDCLIFKGVR